MARSVQTNFTAVKSSAPAAASATSTKEEKKTSSASEDPFSGTVDEILEAVGDDKDKAKKALEAESAKDRPRKTLLEELESRLQEEDGEEK